MVDSSVVDRVFVTMNCQINLQERILTTRRLVSARI